MRRRSAHLWAPGGRGFCHQVRLRHAAASLQHQRGCHHPQPLLPASPLQLRGVTLEDADTIIAGLQQRGLTSFMVRSGPALQGGLSRASPLGQEGVVVALQG